jgi:hypothetical protein
LTTERVPLGGSIFLFWREKHQGLQPFQWLKQSRFVLSPWTSHHPTTEYHFSSFGVYATIHLPFGMVDDLMNVFVRQK